MKYFYLVILLSINLFAQPISWTNISQQYGLPAGVKLFAGTRENPKLKIWYYDVDFNSENVAIKPYFNPSGTEGLIPFIQRFGAIGGINGGYFNLASGASYSALVTPGVLHAKNIQSVVRDSKTYFLTRSFFGFNDTREPTIDWIYHFGNRPVDIYRYTSPIPNAQGTPAPSPSPTAGKPYYEIIGGIGGGPTLVKNSQINITYTEEVFWGSGVGLTNRDPRTAVGFTANNHIIMLVADGRQTGVSDGLSLTELAQEMINLGCVEAMNLDGGGSSQIGTGNTLLNRPEGGTYQRPIPTMLAIVNPDSTPLLPPVFYNKKIDTEESGFTLNGNWLQSTVSGYWGTSPSLYVNSGSGTTSAEYKLNLPKAGTYDLYAWWTSATNRANNTPYYIYRNSGVDTVRLNQSVNGTMWNKIGSFEFSGNENDKLVITNFAEAGKVVIADGIRILSSDSTLTEVKPRVTEPESFRLEQNFPNPFNPETVISYRLPVNSKVTLGIYDILGREVTKLVNQEETAGIYKVGFDAGHLSSGIYMCRIISGDFVKTIKMSLVK
ncbi:MAG: phosphodiester glycosidase family protein [Ignavibacteriaceae bacterium]